MQEMSSKDVVRCAVYVRSGLDSLSPLNSCAQQVAQAKAFIEGHRRFRISKVYSDEGYSAMYLNRPSLKQMFDDIDKGEIDAVVISNIDRITRTYRDFYKVIEFIENREVALVITR